MSVMGPGRVETGVLLLCGGLVGAVARSAWIYSVLCPDRLIGAENPDLAGLTADRAALVVNRG